jgi:hypothetical protein
MLVIGKYVTNTVYQETCSSQSCWRNISYDVLNPLALALRKRILLIRTDHAGFIKLCESEDSFTVSQLTRGFLSLSSSYVSWTVFQPDRHHLRTFPLYSGFPSPKTKFLHVSLTLVSSSVSPWFVILRLTPSIHLSLFGSSFLRFAKYSANVMLTLVLNWAWRHADVWMNGGIAPH